MSFKGGSTETQHVDYSDSDAPRKSHAINALLIFACTVFGAASFLFGFDDKIISPVAALPDFVEKFQGPNPVTGKYVLTARNQNLVFSLPLCALPVLLLLLTVSLPESPQWLAGKGNVEDARRNLRKLRGSSDDEVEEELRLMKLSEENERELHAQTNFWHIFQRQHLKRTLTAGSFFSLNQISGVILSTTYTTVFLTALGVADAFALTIISSCCTLAGTIAAPFVIDRAGRRPTAFIGMAILFIIDAVAGGLAFDTGNKKATMAIAALSFVFNFFWASSFFSLSNVMPSEMATPKLRHHTMAYTIACAQTTAVITTLVVPQLTSADAANLGAKTYLIFAGCMAAIIVFFYFSMPETRGRTFAEIDEMYAAKIPMWKWRSYETSFELRSRESKGL
ncbi:hypothetical protein E8E15_007861 [Penicillium rubens]|nr:hypothetical protein E8E15_007861 [Penicillium rubens]